MTTKLYNANIDVEKMKALKRNGINFSELARNAVDAALGKTLSLSAEEIDLKLKANEEDRDRMLNNSICDCKKLCDSINDSHNRIKLEMMELRNSITGTKEKTDNLNKQMNVISNIIKSLTIKILEKGYSKTTVPDNDWIMSAILGTSIERHEIMKIYGSQEFSKYRNLWQDEAEKEYKLKQHTYTKTPEIRPIDKHINTTEKINYFADPMEVEDKEEEVEEKEESKAEKDRLLNKFQSDFANIGGSTSQFKETEGESEEEYMKDDENDEERQE